MRSARQISTLVGAAIVSAVSVVGGQRSQAQNEALWEAARAGDTARIVAALDRGA